MMLSNTYYYFNNNLQLTHANGLWSHSIFGCLDTSYSWDLILSWTRNTWISNWMFFDIYFTISLSCNTKTKGFRDSCSVKVRFVIVICRRWTIDYNRFEIMLGLPPVLKISLLPYPIPAALDDFMLGKS